MAIETVELIDGIATNREVEPAKRAFAAGIFPMYYTSLRFSDSQRLRPFEVNEDSIRGALLSCKTKKPHGIDWPWAFPRMGMAGAAAWAHPLIDFRDDRAKTNVLENTVTFPRTNQLLELEGAEPAANSTTRRKLALVCVALGGRCGESYTLHSPKNLFPTAPNQMDFRTRELNVIGRWSSSSECPSGMAAASAPTSCFYATRLPSRSSTGGRWYRPSTSQRPSIMPPLIGKQTDGEAPLGPNTDSPTPPAVDNSGLHVDCSSEQPTESPPTGTPVTQSPLGDIARSL